MLFEYHARLISGGNTQNSFIQSKNDVNVVFRGNNNELPKWIFNKAYEIFIHSLVYDVEKVWNCTQCPGRLDQKSDRHERDYDAIECHISDGINMGTIENDVKGITGKEIFEDEIDEQVVVKGNDVKDRTFLGLISQREVIRKLAQSSMKKANVQTAITKL